MRRAQVWAYAAKKNEVFEFKADGSAANTPDLRNARLDIVQKGVVVTESTY